MEFEIDVPSHYSRYDRINVVVDEVGVGRKSDNLGSDLMSASFKCTSNLLEGRPTVDFKKCEDPAEHLHSRVRVPIGRLMKRAELTGARRRCSATEGDRMIEQDRSLKVVWTWFGALR